MVFNADIDDLIGGDRPEELEPAQTIYAPVGVRALATIFKMSGYTVKKRLADCPPAKRKGSGYLYDIGQAARYLVDPVIDIKEFIKGLKTEDLPLALQKDYWDAKKKQQDWELRAGELWRTDDVLEVLGEAFKNLKSSIQLVADTVDREETLSPEQRRIIIEYMDGLQDDLHASLVKMPKKKRTPSLIAEKHGEQVDDEDFIG